ncbi:MAG: CHRD domain-containing protein [Blastocatellia bacterium]|nr:CHRD domain-containing protein [Blastocatellia bacterium]
MKRTIMVYSLLITLLAVTGTTFAQRGGENGERAGAPLFATLTGDAEVPGPGDPDGQGTATITLNQGRGLVCWSIMVTDIQLPASAAHIHFGDINTAGPVVVDLSGPGADGISSGCRSVEASLIMSIRRNPELYYVNVHNPEFPPGAVRGQLRRPGKN